MLGKRFLWMLVFAVTVPPVTRAGVIGAERAGVRGELRLSHGCPGPVREGEKRRCDFAGTRILVRAYHAGSGRLAASDRTDARGRFAIALAPGRYLLRADVKTKDEPTPVSVQAGQWSEVTLRLLIPPYMLALSWSVTPSQLVSGEGSAAYRRWR